MKINTLLIFTIFFLAQLSVIGQDILIAKDGTKLTGEIKEMDRGTITMETSFSDSDFKIEWLNVSQIISPRSFRFTLASGERYYGTISIDTVSGKLNIFDKQKGSVVVEPNQLVYIKQVDGGSVLDVINLAMDFGYSIAKANNLKTLNGSVKGDYIVSGWGVKANYSVVKSNQDDAEPTNRMDGALSFEVFFPRDFYAKATANYYSNNSQMIDLRSTYDAGLGKYFVHTNRIYLNTDIGIAYTMENYSDTLDDRKNIEAKIGLEYNMFDMGDLNLFTKLYVFPSITETGRMRSVFNFTAKYDLPRDFYIKTSLDYQYDTKPIEGVDPQDYVFTFGFGWEL